MRLSLIFLRKLMVFSLVVPLVKNGALVAVLDLDSPSPARFDADDQAGVEKLARVLEAAL